MVDFIRVVPVKGRRVVHPDSFQVLPEEGERVRKAAYWTRMEEQGVIEIIEISDVPKVGERK